MFKKLIEPSPEAVKKAKEDMGAFLKRDFDALPPDEQQAMLDQESRELRAEIDGARKHADELEARFDELVRGRAELTLNEKLRGQ